MKALILCAGLGKRLRPITDKIPKPLITINGKSLLERIVGQLETLGIHEIFLVLGYKAEMIREHLKEKFPHSTFHYLFNPKFDQLNNVYSVFIAKEQLYGSEFMVVNGDIIIDIEILKEALSSSYDNFCVVDAALPLPEDGMKVHFGKDMLITSFGKKIPDGQAITLGINKFSKEGSKMYFDEIEHMLKEGNDDYHHRAILNKIKKHGAQQHALIVKGKWAEIDEPLDIERAEEMFKQ